MWPSCTRGMSDGAKATDKDKSLKNENVRLIIAADAAALPKID